MTLAPGARFGSYELLSALGAGGMGEVHRARDTRLGREVALIAQRKGDFDASLLDLATGAPAEPLLATPADEQVLEWLPDGRAL